MCFLSFCSQSLHVDKWSCGLVVKTLALGSLVPKGLGFNSSLAPLCFFTFCARRQGGRKGLIGQLARLQGGRKGSIGQPARHQGGWGPRLAACSTDKLLGFGVKLLGLRV